MNREDTFKRNQEILRMKKEGYKQTAIAKKFQLTPCQVSRILKTMREELEDNISDIKQNEFEEFEP